jgi:Protein of unknown function (DUF3050)
MSTLTGSRWAGTESQPRVDALQERLSDDREAVVGHDVYTRLTSLDRTRRFMELHVFAVWDFMSLLKALQRELTCVDVPWLPPDNRCLVRLINELVLEEESDLVGDGTSSHFDLYRAGMRQAGADLTAIDSFISLIGGGTTLPDALARCAPRNVQDFVIGDWDVIQSGDPVATAATFAVGREGLIPEMFSNLTHLARQHPNQLSVFVDYLERHIQMDAEVHMPMAFEMVAHLCGEDEGRWIVAERAGRAALVRRCHLWNHIRAAIG